MKLTKCANCGAHLHGPWCAHCGQKVSSLDPSWHDLLRDGIHEFSHLDGKIIATLKMLFRKPGQLTVERLHGRRARYIGAIRLYLTISAIYFILAAVIPNPNPNAHEDQPLTPESRSASASRPAGMRG